MSNTGKGASTEYQKKKKFKEMFRKIVINFFVWLIIIAFVSTLGVYWGNKQQYNVIKIAEVNGKVYTYQPGSPFFYLLSGVRENLSKRYQGKADFESLNNYIVNYSAQLLANNAVIYDFTKKIGITPSKEILRNILEYSLKGRLTSSPDKGLLEYGEMEYANYALSGDNGDIMNVLSVYPTSGELYSYYDLVNFSSVADILYLDVTNYILDRISDADIEKHYIDNISNYASEITVAELTVKTKALAYEILKSALTNGWDAAVNEYRGKSVYNPNLLLKKQAGQQKRFTLVATVKKGDIAPKAQFENGEYHVLRVTGYPPLKSLDKIYREAIVSDYVLRNFSALRTKYDPDLKNSISKAENMIKSGADFQTVSASTGMKYLRSGKITPVSEAITDTRGSNVNLPYLQNQEWLDFLFSAKKGEVSKTFQNGNTIVIFKLLSKGLGKNNIYQDINKDVLVQYMRYKNTAFNQDWSKNLKARYKVKVFEDQLQKLYSKKEEQ